MLTPEQVQQYRSGLKTPIQGAASTTKSVTSLDTLRQNKTQATEKKPILPPKKEKNIVQKGFDATVGDFVKSAVVTPGVRFGQAIGSAGLKIADKITGGKVDKFVQQQTGESLDTRLGKSVSKPADIPVPFTGGVEVAPAPETVGGAIKESVGNAAKTASWVVGGGAAPAAAKATVAGRVGQGLVTGLKAGVAGGALYGGGEAIQEEDATLGSVAKGAAVGGAIGAAAGGLVGGALPAIPATVRVGKNILQPAKIMQRVARVSKGKQAKFEQTAGESIGDYLVKRGIYGSPDDISQQLYTRFTQSKQTADDALAELPGLHKSEVIDTALKELSERESRVSAPGAVSPDSARVNQLLNKHAAEGLTMSEINEAKRLYERNVKLDYVRENKAENIVRANNIDDNIRKWQFSTAENLGLKNLPEINRETRLAKQLLDDIGAEYSGAAGNNAVTLTDWIMLSGGDPTAVSGFLVKKGLSSKKVQSAVAKWIAKPPSVLPVKAQKEAQLALPAPKEGSPQVQMQGQDVIPVLPGDRTIEMPARNPAGTSPAAQMPGSTSPVKPLDDVRIYESYKQPGTIEMGSIPRPKKSNLPVAQDVPEVFSNAKKTEKYIPENELPIIKMGSKTKKKPILPIATGAPKVYPSQAASPTTIKNTTKNAITKSVAPAKNKARKPNTQGGYIRNPFVRTTEKTKKPFFSKDKEATFLATLGAGFGAGMTDHQLRKMKEQGSTEVVEPGEMASSNETIKETANIQSYVPDKYKPVIEEAVKDTKVKPEELAALIQSENGMWDESYVNPAGSDTGLGQHNDATYEDINRLYKKKYGKDYDRTNGEENIKATALWLDHLMTRDGIENLDDAVKAYRIGVAGLMAVREGKGTKAFTEKQLRSMANDKLASFKELLNME